ncbi:hypothetical protein ACIA5C_07750 [Actinoplanes sp. NPDC051343]|uniref:hypothetical protein n=1 Tax=Actinoplanes sp. NPDC051343 TaxID=3363906 RepID=UPI0037AEF7F9
MANPAKILDWAPLKAVRDLVATAKAIWISVPVVVGGIAWAAAKADYPTNQAVVAVSVAATATISVAFAAFWLGCRVGERRSYDVISNCSIHLVEKVHGHHRYTWRRELEIRSRQDGLRLIMQRWYATGQSSKSVIVNPLVHGQAIFSTGEAEQDQTVYRWIYLGRPLAKGERIKTGIEWIYEDDVIPMRPFVVVAPMVKTRYQKITLRFPLADQPKSVEAFVAPYWKFIKQPTPVVDDHGKPKCTTEAAGMIDYVIETGNPVVERAIGMRWESR